MQPIKDLLNKIKWDENLKKEEYVINYLDSVEKKLIPLKFSEILRLEGSFMVIEKDSQETYIPLHRVKEVKEKEKLVWQRTPVN
jgi:uncharacterized protein (UPF0248 family)